MTDDYRDHDHTAKDAFIAFVADPTPGNEHAAELAIANLQRQLDEARAWARGYEHGYFTVDTDHPPG